MIEAQRITLALKGAWNGRYGLVTCPAHDDRTPSLSLAQGTDNRLLAHCFAGCSFGAIIDGLRYLGVVSGTMVGHEPPNTTKIALNTLLRHRAAEAAQLHALRLWEQARPITGTLGQHYLRSTRAITCPLPSSLRFHSGLWHKPSAQKLPSIIAKVEGAKGFAVHRIFLDQSPPRKVDARMLAPTRGGAVRLSSGTEYLAVAEGIETALSLLCGPLVGNGSVWAGLSASGLSSLNLPPHAGQLIIGSDGDEAGAIAAARLAQRAAACGWGVTILAAPQGCDWNDVIRNVKGNTR